MRDIEYKSTGMLFDELITAKLKRHYHPSPESNMRVVQLQTAITRRNIYMSPTLTALIRELEYVLHLCWDSQEIVMQAQKESTIYMDYEKIARAGIMAQKTNAERNKLIRAIDTHLNETDYMPLEKTYQ